MKKYALTWRKRKKFQENSIDYFKNIGDQQFTMDGRNAEITVDLVLQAWAMMSDNKVNGPEDAIVSEMIKQLPLEKINTITRCFQERFKGQMEAPSSRKIVKLIFLRNQMQNQRKGSEATGPLRSHQLFEVVCILHYSFPRAGKGRKCTWEA